MGYFGFRKSFGRGPFRFTLSKRGISSSFGVRGARITAGPSGTYVTIGGHGVHYRERISGSQPNSSRLQPTNPKQPTAQEEQIHPTFQLPVSSLQDSSCKEFVDKLNKQARAVNFVPLLCIISAIICVPLGLSLLPLSLLYFGLLLSCLIGAYYAAKSFKSKNTTTLIYELDDAAKLRARRFTEAVVCLQTAQRLWRVDARTNVQDWKRNSGASSSLDRKSAFAGAISIPRLTSNLPLLGINCCSVQLCFLPDQLLIRSGHQFIPVRYEELRVRVATARFIEAETVPNDAQQVGTTWRYVNKNGDPDRRFTNNRQIPVMMYGEVELASNSGLQVLLQVSSVKLAQQFGQALVAACQFATSSDSAGTDLCQSDAYKRNNRELYPKVLAENNKLVEKGRTCSPAAIITRSEYESLWGKHESIKAEYERLRTKAQMSQRAKNGEKPG